MKRKKAAAFTLIELLVVTSIIILLGALVLVNYQSGQRQYALQRSTHKLAQDLRRAQEMAMSSQEFQGEAVPGGYGLYFTISEPKHYLLFANLEENPNQKYDPEGDTIIEDIRFESGVEITFLSSASLSIVFVPPSPTVYIDPDADSASITLNGKETVTVNKAGLIEIE